MGSKKVIIPRIYGFTKQVAAPSSCGQASLFIFQGTEDSYKPP